MAGDPLVNRAHADVIAQRAAEQLRELLLAVVAEMDPFPPFPGSMFSYGIEVPPVEGEGSALGCVVLAEDGELYELQIGLDMDQVESGDAVAMRSEERIKLDDLTPAQYVGYAHRAVLAAVEYLLERQERGGAAAE